MIFVGTIPAVIVGLGFKDGIERLFDDVIKISTRVDNNHLIFLPVFRF